MDVRADISVDVAVSADLRRYPTPHIQADCTADVVLDADSIRAAALTAGNPPEDEGLYAGLLTAEAITLEGGDGGGGAGASRLVDLTDVDIALTALLDGDALVWDEVAQRWVNAPQTGGGGVNIPNGFHLKLGGVETHGDGDFGDGAVALDAQMSLSEATDRINEVLGRLVPSQPPQFPNGQALTVANTSGASPRLASGVTDNTGDAPYAAGAAVTRITAAGASSNSFGDMGPGDVGTVQGLVNGVVVGSRTLTGVGDNGTYLGLVIADQKDYPVATPGFWKSVDISLSLIAAALGVNKIKINHTAGGVTADVYFVRDGMVNAPSITAPSLVENFSGTLAYSSSVPHYGTGAQLTGGCSVNNLSGETYYGGADPLVISGTNGIISSDTFGYAALGVATPIARQSTGAVALTPQAIDIDGANVHNVGIIQATARNVNGASAATNLSSKLILVKRGSAGSRIDENSITVSGLGSSPNADNAVRVTAATGDTPAGAPTAWDSTAALQTYDGAVVAGVMKHDQTNYATGYLPVGPDLSIGRSGDQWFEYSLKRAARSSFKINVTGSYAGVRVKLPGASDLQPNAPNGWWDAFKPYDGAGVPGETGDTDAGCGLGTPMTGGSGSFSITFGTESSTNATGNEILVRFKLTAGQSITALSFTN